MMHTHFTSLPGRAVTTPMLTAALGMCLAWPGLARADTPANMLAYYVAQAGRAPNSQKGQQFFTNLHGHEWRCASCHGATPIQPGQHAATGKSIRPLAPAFNPDRFTDAAKTEKWFRRNCNDVVGRECTAAEKADVLAWLITLKERP